MIPSSPFGAFAGDKLADAAEELADELRLLRDVRFTAACEESYLLTASISELRLLALMLRRSPVAQQRIATRLLDQAGDRLRAFDA